MLSLLFNWVRGIKMVNSRLCEAARPWFQKVLLKSWDSKTQNHPKTRLQNVSQTLPRFGDHAKIFQDPHFSRNYSIHLELRVRFAHYIFFWNINSQFSSCRLKSSTNWSVCWKILCYSKSKLSDIPYPRTKLFTKLFEDHTLDSGTYLYNLCYRSKLGLGDKELRINLG